MSKLKKFFIDLIKKTKNKFRNIDKKKLLLTLFNLFLKLLVIMFITLIIYIYSQFFCNGKFVFEKERMVLNFILIIIIIEFFYMLTGKLKLSLYISMILTFIIGIINHFVTAFRGTPLVPWDVFSVNVALTVLPTFKFTFTKKAILGIITFIIGLVILSQVKFKNYNYKKAKIVFRIVLLLIISNFLISFYFTDMINKYDLNENWDPKEEYHNNGLIASLFKQSRNLIITKPDTYNFNSIYELAQNILVPIPEGNIENSSEEKIVPNIIVIMNESFSDLSVIGNFTTNTEYLSYFRSLTKNTIRGNLHMSVFGAQTPNSEWEFLTSNSMAFVTKRSIPYQQYVLRKSYSLATILKSQNYSASAFHIYYPQGYNRNLAYPRLGFESFLSMNDVKDIEYIREYPSDMSAYKTIIDLYENRDLDKNFFNFTVTMQNHGSYTDENFENTVVAAGGEYPKLNQYLSILKIADSSFKYLINYFENEEEPTLIVMFGDHQPYVEDEFYNNLLAQNYTDINSREAIEKKYITPYIIWANYDIDEEKYSNLKNISVNYLSSVILDVAGLKKSPYLEFLYELKNKLPIITGNGYVDINGIYHDFSEKNEYSEDLEKYSSIQYNNMFDNNNRLSSLFEIVNY